MSELAAGVGNRRAMSYEASKFGKKIVVCMGFVWELLRFGGFFFAIIFSHTKCFCQPAYAVERTVWWL